MAPNFQKVTIIHLRCYEDENTQPLPHGGMTIAYREKQESVSNATDNVVFEVAIARCHPNDNFNRKIGRAVAEGHLFAGRYYELMVELDQLDGLYDLVVEFANTKDNELTDQHEALVESRYNTKH